MPFKLKFLILNILFITSSIVLNAQNRESLFRAHDTLSLTRNSMYGYFSKLKDRYKIVDHYEKYIRLTEEMKRNPRFSENRNMMNLIYLFEADYHSVSQHQGPSLLAIQNIDFSDSKFTMLDRLRAYIFGYGASLELGLYQKCINYAGEIETLKIQYPDQADSIDKQTLYFVYEARVYYAIGDYKQAIKFAKANYVQRVKDTTIDVYYFFNRLNNLGLYYSLDKQIDSSLFYYNKANELLSDPRVLAKADGDELNYLESIVSGNIGKAIMQEGRYKEAIPKLQKDIEYSEYLEPNDAILSMYALFHCYSQLREFGKAKKFLQRINEYILDKNLELAPGNALRIENYKMEFFRLTQNLQMENASLQKIIDLKNSIQEIAKIKQTEALQFAFIFDKKEREINKAKTQEKELKNQLSLNNDRILVLITLISFLLISLFFIFFYIRKKAKTRKQLESLNSIISQKNITIENSLKQKEILLTEIHHRVKNNLQMISSLLSLQISKLDNLVAIEALIDGQSRVKAIAMVHQNLYESEDLSQINFCDYLNDLVANLKQAQGKENIFFEIVSDLEMDLDLSVSLGLVVTEAITNSFKHNQSKNSLKIEISLLKFDPENYQLIINDNGSGFDVDSLNTNNTLGIKIMQLLTQNIRGEFNLNSSEKGTTYKILIPVNQP